jgi:DNA-binding CsgD family transcriptional regulator
MDRAEPGAGTGRRAPNPGRLWRPPQKYGTMVRPIESIVTRTGSHSTRRGEGVAAFGAPLERASGVPAANAAVRALLLEIDRHTGKYTAGGGMPGSDRHAIGLRLDAAEDDIETLLRRAQGHGDAESVRLWELLLLLRRAKVTLAEAELLERNSTVVKVQESLQRLRAVSKLDQLVKCLPGEIGHLGFARAVVSRVERGVWTVRTAFVYDDPEAAALLVRTGRDQPARLTPALVESELLRRRRPMLVPDAQHNPRVHHGLVNAVGVNSYVSAPLVAGNNVVGFLHADLYQGATRADQFSRDLLGMFAEGVGHTVERISYRERLRAVRSKLAVVTDAIDEYASRDMDLELSDDNSEFSAPDGGLASALSEPVELLRAGYGGPGDPNTPLTRREFEILRHLAEGRTNAAIAAHLVLSEGTVKTHVRNILRKLGVSNRVEAVASFHSHVHRT